MRRHGPHRVHGRRRWGIGRSSPCFIRPNVERVTHPGTVDVTLRRLFVYNEGNLAEHLGIFEQAVLIALVRLQTDLGRERYGRAVLKEVEQRLQRRITAGAVYSTLDRLEAKGLVRSE